MKSLLTLAFCWLAIASALGQTAIKTNLLYDATGTMNLGVETAIAPSWTLLVTGNYNPWTYTNDQKIRHWAVLPEVRYWGKKGFEKHFFGIHLLGEGHNIGNIKLPFGIFEEMQNSRFQGWGIGGGIGYGYAWKLGKHFRLEAEVGVGYIHTQSDVFSCEQCAKPQGTRTYNYVGPTKLSLNIAYVFGKKRQKTVPATEPMVKHVAAEPEVLIAEDKRVKEINKPQPPKEVIVESVYETELDFLLKNTEIDLQFNNNQTILTQLDSALTSLKSQKGFTIKQITITGYSSPEGSVKSNEALAEARANNLKVYLQTRYSFNDNLYKLIAHGEDWERFIAAVPTSGMWKRDKVRVMRAIEKEDRLDKRELDLMGIHDGMPFEVMQQEIFPTLRTVRLKIEYSVVQ